jgi:uncharacterized repeat protein (TIGR03987 family)
MEPKMDTFILIGAITITAGLLAYSIAIITEQIKNKINYFILFFLTLGVILDITATSLMIYGSSNSAFTLHGTLGYSALLAMVIDTILIWKSYLKNGPKISRTLHRYSLVAYIWWVIAFITGALLVR